MPGMQSEPSGPVDDPFFDEVRRRHPDVDIVLLPPGDGEQDAADAPVADDDAVASARILVATAARQLWDAAAPGSDLEPDERLGYGAHEGWVRSAARVAEPRDDGPDVLDRLERELRGRGADVRREPGGAAAGPRRPRRPDRHGLGRRHRRRPARRGVRAAARRRPPGARAGAGLPMTMDMIPESVGRAAQAWDEQSLDVGAAADQVAGAGTSGFTAPVSSAASRFLRAWERHADGLAGVCEGQADGLRTTMTTWISTDEAASNGYFHLLPYVTETR